MKASTVLTRVIKLFESGRWTKGNWSRTEPGTGICTFCLDGAVNYIVHEKDKGTSAEKALNSRSTSGVKKYLKKVIRKYHKDRASVLSFKSAATDIIRFNDNYADSAACVIEIVKNARKLARKDEALDK
jgi:hypothetical protein